MHHSPLGRIDEQTNREHYERKRRKGAPRILRLEVEEAILSTRASDWRWENTTKHGLRRIGHGFTARRRAVFLIIVPDDPDFDRYTDQPPEFYGGQWDDCRQWMLISAYPV